MISLTFKEKKWTVLLLLPLYFIFGQFVFSFLFLGICKLLGINMSVEQLDAVFNMVYLIFMAVVSIMIYQSYLKKSFHHMKGKWLKQLFYSCTLGTFQFYLFNMVSSLFILLINPYGSSANQDAIASLTAASPIVMVITTVILAPFVEEMIFRVGIFQLVYERSRILAYIFSSLSFGFVHIMVGLFQGDFSQLLFLFPYSLLGFALCHFYEKRNSIFVPMLIHSLNNLIAMLVLI